MKAIPKTVVHGPRAASSSVETCPTQAVSISDIRGSTRTDPREGTASARMRRRVSDTEGVDDEEEAETEGVEEEGEGAAAGEEEGGMPAAEEGSSPNTRSGESDDSCIGPSLFDPPRTIVLYFPL
jgi:hypothetical protein